MKKLKSPQQKELTPQLVNSYINRKVGSLMIGYEYEKDLKNDLYSFLIHKGLMDEYHSSKWRKEFHLELEAMA